MIRIEPSDSDIAWWMHTFVPERALWLWDDSPIPHEERADRVIAPSELRSDPDAGSIQAVNAFHLWAISPETTRVIIESGQWLAELSDTDQSRAQALQVKLNRGMCVPRDRFPADLRQIDHATHGGKVVLDYQLWQSLPTAARRQVIRAELPDWDDELAYPVPEAMPVHQRGIANGFIQQEGVNCLAVAAYAITGRPGDLLQWLHPEEFLEILEQHGYAPSGGTEPQSGDVLTFSLEGAIVHAAYCLAPNRILNKSGQSSFNPVRIIDAPILRREWDDYRLMIYRRG